MYDFILKIIDDFILTYVPKINLRNSDPLLLSILEFIELLYQYGIISEYFSKKVLSSLFLISEILENLERKY